MTDHGIAERYPAWVIHCTCGDVLLVKGGEDPMPSYGAHAQGSKPLHRAADHATHERDLGRIRIFKEK